VSVKEGRCGVNRKLKPQNGKGSGARGLDLKANLVTKEEVARSGCARGGAPSGVSAGVQARGVKARENEKSRSQL